MVIDMKKKVIILITFILLIISFLFWAKGCLDIDKCLDSGGRWNYETGECEYTQRGSGHIQ